MHFDHVSWARSERLLNIYSDYAALLLSQDLDSRMAEASGLVKSLISGGLHPLSPATTSAS